MKYSILTVLAFQLYIGPGKLSITGNPILGAGGAPLTFVDCADNTSACTLVPPSDSHYNLTFDPYPTTGGFTGYADYSFRTDPQTGTVWWTYSYLYSENGTHTLPGCTNASVGTAQVIETHVAFYNSTTQQWSNSGLTNGGIVRPVQTICNASQGTGGTVNFVNNEVSNIAPFVNGGVTYWPLITQSYDVVGGGSTTLGYTKRFAYTWCAGTATQGPMCNYGLTPTYIGSSAVNTDSNFPISIKLDLITGVSAVCSGVSAFVEPSLRSISGTQMAFGTGCGDLSSVLQFVTSISYPTPTLNFTYAGNYATASAAAGICSLMPGCVSTNSNRITQTDVFTCGAATCMQGSLVYIDGSGNKICYGFVSIPFAAFSPPVLATTGGHLNVIDTVTSSTSQNQGPGSSTADPSIGVVIAHKRYNCTAGTPGCSYPQNATGLFTYPLVSGLFPTQ